MKITMLYCDRCGKQIGCRDTRYQMTVIDKAEATEALYTICLTCHRIVFSKFARPEGE